VVNLVIIQQICAYHNVHLLQIIMVIQQMVDVFYFVVKVYGHKMEPVYVYQTVARIHMLII
jgi:hypothetical protein